MYSSIYLKRFRRLLILGAVVAGLTASAAGARLDPGTPPDVSDVASRLSVAPATADAFERYAAAHPYGSGLTSSQVALRVTPQGLKADGLRWQGIAKVY